MKNENSIGARIQSYRKLQNMTQDELSKRAGIYLSTIKKYENGERHPKLDQLLIISEALGVSINAFLDLKLNTVSDVLSLIMKLDEQGLLDISVHTDENGKIIPSSISFSFTESQVNEAICSYLEYKATVAAIQSASDPAAIEAYDYEQASDAKKRLLMYSEQLKKNDY